MASDNTTPSAPQPAPRPTHKSRKARRWLVVALTLPLLVLVLSIGGAGWILQSERGAQTALSLAERFTVGMVTVEQVEGSFDSLLRVGRLQIKLENQTIVIDRLALSLRPRELLQGRLHVTTLNIGKLNVSSKIDQKSEPATLPTSISLPLRVKIDGVQVEGGELAWGPLNVVTLGAFAFNLDYDGERYLLNLDRFSARSTSGANAFAGDVQGRLELATAKPYALDAALSIDSENTVGERTIAAKGKITAGGSLAQIQLGTNLRIDAARIEGHMQLQPFADRTLGEADLQVRQLDLALLAEGLPTTALDLDLKADERGNGTLSLRNPAAGLYDGGRAPLSRLQVDFSQTAQRLDISNIAANLGSQQRPAGTIQGSGHMKDGALNMTLKTDALDLQRLDGRMRATKLAGSLLIRHATGRQEFTLSLAEPLKRNPLTLQAHALVADDAIVIDKAELRAGNSAADVTARIGLADTQAFDATAKIRNFDPRNFGDFADAPKLMLNADLAAKGKRHPALEADANFRINDSQLEGQALTGNGQLALRAQTLSIPALTLTAGSNRLSAQGSLAEQNARIEFHIDAPNLAQLGKQFGGVLKLDGDVRGNVQQPKLAANWTAKGLRLPGQLQVDGTQGKLDVALDRRANAFLLASLGLEADAQGLRTSTQQLRQLTASARFGGQASAPLMLRVRGDGISGAQLDAEHFEISGDGTTAQHVLRAVLAERQQNWNMEARGGLQNLARNPEWRGTIARLDADGRLNVKLSEAASLQASQQQVLLERFNLALGGGSIAIDQFLRNERGITTRGHIARLPLADLLRYGAAEAPINTDMTVGGEWDLRMSNRLDGSFNLRRESGDIAMLSNTSARLGLTTLSLNGTSNNGRLGLHFLAEGSKPGRIAVDLDTVIGGADSRFSIAPSAPFTGRARVDAPTLNWLGPLVSQTLVTEGSVKADVAIDGTFGRPRFSGGINADRLRVLMTDTGVDLRNGTLRSHFQGDQLVVDDLTFRNGEGTLNIRGPLSMVRQELALELNVNASRYLLLDRFDRKLVISGSSVVGWRAGQAKANGRFTVDSGMIDIGSSEAPQLSDDVIVVGQSDKQGTRTVLALDVGIDLGKGIQLTGRGIDGTIVGDIRLLADAGGPLRAEGTLRVAKGTFKAYGRELAIEQGLLRFNGPLNNPNIDILAMRRGQDVEAGVSVRGTVMTPRITLVSDPVVADAEKLSWLVLGRSLSGAGEGDISALQAAASSLLTQGAAAGVSSQIATAFGLDDFSIGTSDTGLQQRIVTLGKRISSRLYVSYKQGLETASSVLLLRYTLTPRITVEGEAGTTSALTLFYNFAFD
ncbi:translocation/assembly module TamB domain-containing protein [uncultured Oxalicibacterium sp.]|uniref:translocation/assembly module TamB domain-containing protein n=1 Tax=uncultured Oxalicibacterium sp. TaxID=1168540 RepID=UPI0025F976CD|nr:translocation/assembly module TamB domain-containing protein [uncultured Oxalicibacterium sp.]